jgi:hypothetical protein
MPLSCVYFGPRPVARLAKESFVENGAQEDVQTEDVQTKIPLILDSTEARAPSDFMGAQSILPCWSLGRRAVAHPAEVVAERMPFIPSMK